MKFPHSWKLACLALMAFSCSQQTQTQVSTPKASEAPTYFTSEEETLYLGEYQPSAFSQSLQPGNRILELEDWNVWGCSPIMGPDGKVHVFFSRWPGDHSNWLTQSEIAHAVADQPEGPYTVIGTVLKGRGGAFWDAHTIHNPTVQKVGDKYAMFYLGNNLDRAADFDGQHASTQRIGLAMADDLNGPWTRVSEEPILDISDTRADWDSYLTTNPALLQHPDGRYWLYYKAWDRYNDKMRKMGVAISDQIEGPYEKVDTNPLVSFSHLKKQVEDAYVFYHDAKFYMVMRDMGVIHPHAGLILESKDGLNWSEPMLGYGFSRDFLGEEKIERFERPQVLMIDGQPSYLFLAAMGGKYGTSTAAVLKIDHSIFK
ncbi:glycoside hydrolase family protein [Pontibacter sp. G13]|uniref:glycoside hydrolase family protein n=1 Tax=Pontibacter sp. G13 TaxID=3074898 RepID=UPI00288A21CB|nr:glycoside hydrolase family protein [Pontibacter sp. G13]WNJ16994.1 glycoside hydrolase family protein [Pontibacter sp. G13]